MTVSILFITLQILETVTLTTDYSYYVTIHNRDCIPISFVTIQMLETNFLNFTARYERDIAN